ncbi:hypothetical protein [Rubellimicrobium aerolatum]|uniref:VPLPA-CTERM sorting domain-containing protein n=1 Tax=Rubellimicrobium aerolatum TaxID=490979 RepID=A0ABW0SAS5_9RHOB|nr:hypothetical protein [Rubellimicrobium aerolatum]MBP1806084.1 hypothetical protein [Rubellimicrobium aerolatum]
MKPLALPLLAAALLPTASGAATISRILADLTASGRFTSGSGFPDANDFDSATVLVNGLQSVEALAPAALPFPGVPNSVGTGFASAAGDALGNFGVGVNTFSFTGADPAFQAFAFGSYTETILNDTPDTITLGTSFFIPAPEIRFAGQIGDFLPPGAEARDITAEVSARIFTSLTRADGSLQDDLVFDYGMIVGRDPATGELGTVTLSPDAEGLEIEEGVFSTSFRFTLDEQDVVLPSVATLAPGDSVTIDFQYFAEGSNGFGETGYVAAIGDPFALSSSGRFLIEQTDGLTPPPTPAPVPLPASLPLLALALAGLGLAARRRA